MATLVEAIPALAVYVYNLIIASFHSLFVSTRGMTWTSSFFLSAVLSVLLLLYFVLSRSFPRKTSISNQHVIITGGSSGIGLACAKECVRRGAHVTLIARDEKKLERAKNEVLHRCGVTNDDGRVAYLSCDVAKDCVTVERAMTEAALSMERRFIGRGHVAALINCAGSGPGAAFDQTPPERFEDLMRLNYFSAVYSTRAVLTEMKTRQRGRILFVSSQAGQLGLYGYTAYSAAKFALRGFAEALLMETKPHNVFVTLAFPPDTNTPGFAEESKSLPEETKEISATAGLFEPEDVAKKMIDDLEAGNFFCTFGLDGFMLGTLTAGMSPASSVVEIVVQFVFMSVFRIVGLFYLATFDGICRKWKVLREQNKAK